MCDQVMGDRVMGDVQRNYRWELSYEIKYRKFVIGNNTKRSNYSLTKIALYKISKINTIIEISEINTIIEISGSDRLVIG